MQVVQLAWATALLVATAQAVAVSKPTNCTVDEAVYPLCVRDAASWGFENGKICVARSFCPATKPSNQKPVSKRLVSDSPTPKTRAVFEYLSKIWGSKTLAGVQDQTWRDSIDMYARVVNESGGKAPALMGYDFMNYFPNKDLGNGTHQVEEAIAHWKRGGLIAFCWHWRVGQESEFYSRSTNFSIPIKNNQLDVTSTDFKAIVHDIDIVGAQLKRLQNAGVPVIWRPLHEASGGWFWWGRTRSDGVPPAYAYTLLYRYIFDRLTHHHQLHNLIWVWNGQKASWYPGDAYADVVGTDIYDGQQNYVSHIDSYKALKEWPTQTKLVTLSETSNIPDPDLIAKDGAWWLYFIVWNDGVAGAGVNDSNNFWSGEYYNTNAHKVAVMHHPNVVTLDKLPKF